MKKWLLTFLIFSPLATTHAFLDIAPEDPQGYMLRHLGEVGVMKGYGDGNFHPEKIVTRAEALTVALRSGGIQIPESALGKTYFEDVDPNQWYAPFIVRGVDVEVVSNEHKRFRPNDPITKAEFLAFLFRATQVNFNNYSHKTRAIAKDIQEDDWFAPHFAYAKKYQIAHLPPDQMYRPFKYLSRREVGIMTYRQLRLFYGDKTTKIFVELQAEIEQFITLLRGGYPEKAEMHLQKIMELNSTLAMNENNADAIAANAIARALEHFSDSLRALKFDNRLAALENLHLAAKQVQRAMNKSEKMLRFALDLSTLIDETLYSFIDVPFSNFSQR
ncbi:S-layer homology domain-containing protein [Candidatus Gracilibacteria bacterium]|nr:S-layer homology domain-containing protein [Candidatus Gracilibacteria bacterium]MCF7819599.1 S-layer homology domain-containing protein [Candidatus Gracilibacteria bacterium]